MSSFRISASLLSADFARLGEEATAMLAAGADRLHFDIMDQHYVPNLTMGPMVCRALREYGITAPFDVHLMVKPVDDLITAFADAGATYISIHPEATEHLDRSLQLILDNDCQAGLVFNPATPLHHLNYVLSKLDFILLMTVNPGFGGQVLIPEMLDKIKEARRIISTSGYDVHVAVDGGVNADNIRQLAHAGADTFVMGSALFNTPDYAAAVKSIRAELTK